MSRDEQLELNRFIIELLKSKFKENFWTKLQGGDTAKTLVVIAGNKKVIARIHNYLINELNLIISDGAKKHGNGGNFTRLINLSEIDTETINQIKRKVDLNNRRIMKKGPTIIEKRLAKPIISTIPSSEPVAELIPDVVKFEKDHDLKSFTTSVSWMLKFEGVKSRSFSCDRMEPGKYCVICKSPSIASMVYSYLIWLAGDSTLVESDKDIVIIDYAGRVKKGKEFDKIHFCLPPAGAADSEEIKRRLIKISSGSKPEISDLGDGKFLVTYVRSNFVKKIFSVLESMKWNVDMKDESSFVITITEKQTAIDIIPPTAPAVLEVDEVSIPSTDRDGFDLEVVQNQVHFFLGIETKEEVIMELKKLFGDSELFIKLSSSMQKRIISVLREEFRKQNPEEYAIHLLSIIGK